MSIAEKSILIAENQKKIYDTAIFESGKRAVYDAFWDTYQDNGNREHYSYAFAGKGWTDETFKPKYDIRPGYTMATNLFAYSQITDLVSILNKQGVVLDTSLSTDIGGMYTYCSNLITCPPIDASNSKHCNSLFLGCGKVDNIKLKIKKYGSQTFTNTFKYCNWLYSLEIDGVIGQDIDLQWSDLSKASILSVLKALATDVTGKTATFKSGWQHNTEVKAAIAARPNWTISFV
jgi:hypothetical protein